MSWSIRSLLLAAAGPPTEVTATAQATSRSSKGRSRARISGTVPPRAGERAGAARDGVENRDPPGGTKQRNLDATRNLTTPGDQGQRSYRQEREKSPPRGPGL